jgi:hypothetical protein
VLLNWLWRRAHHCAVDYRDGTVSWRALYRSLIPMLEHVLAEMRVLARGQTPLRRVELGLMDIGLVSDQLAQVIERLAYWDRVAAAAVMDA